MRNNAPNINIKEQFIRSRFILTVGEAAAANFNTAHGLPHAARLDLKMGGLTFSSRRRGERFLERGSNKWRGGRF